MRPGGALILRASLLARRSSSSIKSFRPFRLRVAQSLTPAKSFESLTLIPISTSFRSQGSFDTNDGKPLNQIISAPLDKDFGHHRRYDRKELRHKLRHAGFSIVRLNYFNWVGYVAWWLSFRVLRKRRFDVRSVVIFDRLIFPLIHAFERNVLRPPFGQSLLAVAQAGVTSQAG